MRKTLHFLTLSVLAGALFIGSLAQAPAAAADSKPGTRAQSSSEAIYVCPMHPKVSADKPGRCPECKMHLTKVTASYYCPMHPEETSDKPGRCPECKMHLKKAKR